MQRYFITNMPKTLILTTLLIFFISFNGYSQIKFEQEKRILKSNVPEKALLFIEDLPLTKKVKWYKEISQDGITIEAKSCHNNHKYSIEFTDQGEIIDIEKKKNFKYLENTIKAKINSELDSIFTKYIIKKTQIQYTDLKGDINFIFEKSDTENFAEPNYELIVRGKDKGIFSTYEITFDHNGVKLKILKITQRTSDNIEF